MLLVRFKLRARRSELYRSATAVPSAIAGTSRVSVWARHLELTEVAPDHRVHDERGGEELQGSDDATGSLPTSICHCWHTDQVFINTLELP